MAGGRRSAGPDGPIAAITLGLEPSLSPLVFASALAGSLGFALTGALGAALAFLAAWVLFAAVATPFAGAAAVRNAQG